MIMSQCIDIDFVPIYDTIDLAREVNTLRKVLLRMNELYTYTIIKKVVDTNGNKRNAASKLNCTIRTINRLIIKYKTEGKAGFVHKNRNRRPSTTFSSDTKEKILHLYQTTYAGANLLHFSELLEEYENIHVSDSTLNRWFREVDILSPKARRKTIKKHKKELQRRKAQVKTIKEIRSIEEKLEIVDRNQVHPRRSRCAYTGELIQMDASPHRWFGGIVTHLHLAIDDATGKIVGAYFDTQETLQAYYQITYQILTNYGIPVQFLTDRRTIFEYKRSTDSSDEKDTFTQFSYACKQLGIDLACTSVPQAKGRVERLNQTLQSRLVSELNRAGISTIEEANAFLQRYIIKYNQKFALPINKTKNAFEKSPSSRQINQILAVITRRKIDAGNCIRFNNKYYLPILPNTHTVYLHKGVPAMVIQAFDHCLYVNIKDQLFALKEVPVRKEVSKELDIVAEKNKPKRGYVPPLSHPWKQASFKTYLQKQSHRKNGVNI